MKIISISDFHGNVDVLGSLLIKIRKEKTDLIVFSGDIVKGGTRGDEWLSAKKENRPPKKDKKEIIDEKSKDSEFYKLFYLSLIELEVPICTVPGNMDAPKERYFDQLKVLNIENSFIHIVHSGLWENDKFCVMGFGGEITRNENERFFVLQYIDKEFEDYWKKFIGFESKKIKVFITHTPPVGKVGLEGNFHRGNDAINKMLKEMKPDFLFCGHAHEAQAYEYIGNTLAVNPGALKKNNLAVVDTDTQKVRFEKI